MIFSIEDTFTSLALDESNFLTKATQMVVYSSTPSAGVACTFSLVFGILNQGHIQEDAKVCHMSTFLRQKRLNWYGHIRRREEDKPVKKNDGHAWSYRAI